MIRLRCIVCFLSGVFVCARSCDCACLKLNVFVCCSVVYYVLLYGLSCYVLCVVDCVRLRVQCVALCL